MLLQTKKKNYISFTVNNINIIFYLKRVFQLVFFTVFGLYNEDFKRYILRC